MFTENQIETSKLDKDLFQKDAWNWDSGFVKGYVCFVIKIKRLYFNASFFLSVVVG